MRLVHALSSFCFDRRPASDLAAMWFWPVVRLTFSEETMLSTGLIAVYRE
jgi:hypothetical protein